jgi:hypothetical protein
VAGAVTSAALFENWCSTKGCKVEGGQSLCCAPSRQLLPVELQIRQHVAEIDEYSKNSASSWHEKSNAAMLQTLKNLRQLILLFFSDTQTAQRNVAAS